MSHSRRRCCPEASESGPPAHATQGRPLRQIVLRRRKTGRGHLSRAWTLIEAAAVRDRTLTSWPSLKIDLTNAGAEWVDEPVHVDTNGPNLLISSRKPDDLPAFTQRMVDTFAAAPAGLARS